MGVFSSSTLQHCHHNSIHSYQSNIELIRCYQNRMSTRVLHIHGLTGGSRGGGSALCIRIQMYSYTSIYSKIRACLHTYIHTNIHTRLHAYMFARNLTEDQSSFGYAVLQPWIHFWFSEKEWEEGNAPTSCRLNPDSVRPAFEVEGNSGALAPLAPFVPCCQSCRLPLSTIYHLLCPLMRTALTLMPRNLMISLHKFTNILFNTITTESLWFWVLCMIYNRLSHQ